MSGDGQRNVSALLVVAAAVLIVGSAIGATSTVFVGGGTPISTQSGLEVTPAQDGQLDLSDPWVDSRSIEFKNVTFRGHDASITVDQFGDPATGGQWTNLSSTSAANGQFYIDRADSRQIGASGTVDSLAIRDSDLGESVDNVDVVATAGGDWTLIINDTGLSEGRGIVAKHADTGEALGGGVVNTNGDVVLDDMDTVTDAPIDLKLGASELLVFKESSPNELVQNAQLRVRVYGDDEVYEREVTDGQLRLSGIPTDEQLTITVSDEETNYIYRRTTIPSATYQAEVYLLNGTSNDDVSNVFFDIDDRTGGQFSGGQARFIIEKAITKDFDGDGTDETQYQIISGDTFGSGSGYQSTLESNERYRLKVTNDQGDTRLLGSYTVRGDSAETLTIGEVTLDSDTEQGYVGELQSFARDTNGDGTTEQYIRVVYDDGDRQTEQLRYTVTDKSNGETIADEVVGGPLGTHTNTFKVDDNETSKTYELDWEATRETENGTDVTVEGTKYAGDVPEIAGDLPIDPRWLELIGFVSIVAIAGLIVIIDSAMAALAATGWASLLTVLGIVAIPMPALGLAGAVTVVALVGRR